MDTNYVTCSFVMDRDIYNAYKSIISKSGGCGISWDEDIDISECELWENGTLE